MTSWTEFSALQREMAAAGRDLLYDVGVGLGFLATVAPDGAPRVHPICPLISDDGLFAFIVPSPKQRDLHRDGRYALHSIPLERNEDAFYITGRTAKIDEPSLRSRLEQQFVEERAALDVPAPGPDQDLFEFSIAMAMLTRTTGHGDPAPRHTVWHGR